MWGSDGLREPGSIGLGLGLWPSDGEGEKSRRYLVGEVDGEKVGRLLVEDDVEFIASLDGGVDREPDLNILRAVSIERLTCICFLEWDLSSSVSELVEGPASN